MSSECEGNEAESNSIRAYDASLQCSRCIKAGAAYCEYRVVEPSANGKKKRSKRPTHQVRLMSRCVRCSSEGVLATECSLQREGYFQICDGAIYYMPSGAQLHHLRNASVASSSGSSHVHDAESGDDVVECGGVDVKPKPTRSESVQRELSQKPSSARREQKWSVLGLKVSRQLTTLAIAGGCARG